MIDLGKISGGILDAYRLFFEQQLRKRMDEEARGADFADWQRRLQYQQELERPERERLAGERERAETERQAEIRRRTAREKLDFALQRYKTEQAAYAAMGNEYLALVREAGFGETPTRPGTAPLTLGGFGSPLEAIRSQAGQTVQIPTGKPELNIPGAPKRVLLGEYDSRFAGTPYAATPVPMTADGDPDVRAIAEYSRLAGIRAPAVPETPQARRQRVEGEVQRLYQRVQGANTPEDARVAAVNYNNRLVEARKGGVSLPFAPVNVARAVADARARQKKAGGGGEGSVGAAIGGPSTGEVRLPSGKIVEAYPIYKKGTKVVTHYAIRMDNGLLVQFTPDQARVEAGRLFAVGDDRARDFAAKVGRTPKEIAALKADTSGLSKARADLRKLDDEIAIQEELLRDPLAAIEARKNLPALRVRRRRLLERYPQLSGGKAQPIRPSGPPPVEDLSDLGVPK